MVAIGQLLDRRYRISQILAAGGFGQTFLAEDTRRPGSPLCVVKQLGRSNNQKGFQIARRLFNKEAEMLEKLGQLTSDNLDKPAPTFIFVQEV